MFFGEKQEYYKIVERKLDILSDIVRDCGRTLVTACEMFPTNARNEALRLRMKEILMFPEIFCEDIPDKKSGNEEGNCDNENDTWENWPTQFTNEVTKMVDEVSFGKTKDGNMADAEIPNFSLGISQIEPRNLCADMNMENTVQVMNVGQGAKSTRDLKGKVKVSHQIEEAVVGKRPRREVRPSNNLKSPYVRRATELTGRQISSEEDAVWTWLFKDKRKNK